MKTDGILFDLDGTLWDSVDEIVYTWNLIIARHPGLRPPIDRAEQETLMGLQMDEIARRLFPNEPPERQSALMRACIQEENRYLRAHGGRLYPGLVETLDALRGTYPLFIVSNCQSGYIEAFLHAHGLEERFDGFLCFGDTGRSKGENILTVQERYGLQAPVYVGDTQGDRDSAAFAGTPFLYAAYGFGQVTQYDAKINSLPELPGLLERREEL